MCNTSTHFSFQSDNNSSLPSWLNSCLTVIPNIRHNLAWDTDNVVKHPQANMVMPFALYLIYVITF